MKAQPLTGVHLLNFRKALLWWYSIHARDLPWRRTRDPYKIWVSEIMLQQTRVAAVIPIYRSFVGSYPTIPALALASEEEILAQWSGLGYYKRARHLHQAARLLLHSYGGKMPHSYAELLKLPGVGQYTAAAVASIAFEEPVAVVDGNVERVLTRVLGATGGKLPTRKRIEATAQKLLDPHHAGTFNQAMMELGALLCTPRLPLCVRCPVQEYCRTQNEHPVPPRPKPLSVPVAYQVLRRSAKNPVEILLLRRPLDAAHMPGMWELPMAKPATLQQYRPVWNTKHAITKTRYAVSVYDLGVAPAEPHAAGREVCWANGIQLQSLPLTGLTRKILMRLQILVRPLDGMAEEDALPTQPMGPTPTPLGPRRNVAMEDGRE